MITSRLAALMLAFSLPLLAAPLAIGKVSSAGTVTVGGTRLEAAGVISWTVLSGDEITTGADSAIILLRNEARVILSAHSKVSLSESKITLFEGGAFVSCPIDCGVTVNVRGRSSLMRRGSRVQALVNGASAELTTGGAAQEFVIPADKLTQRLPYTWGVHLPDSEK